MKILLTNDDGIYAPGLKALYDLCVVRHSVTVVAPDRERSAIGHAITLNKPIRSTKVNFNGKAFGYAVSGTPADCVKFGIMEVLSDRPDLVISGINAGANVGVNINYSGTVAAAKEAAMYGIKAIAVSIASDREQLYQEASIFVERLGQLLLREGLPPGTFLNVNFPNRSLDKSIGVRICRQGISLYDEYFERRVDPRNRTYYWQGCDSKAQYDTKDIDGAALDADCISITPIKCDMTDYQMIEALRKWKI